MANNTKEILAKVEEYIEKIENGEVKDYRISKVCDELSIFDWFKERLSKTQLMDMRKFLREALKLGYTGYVCFKVGASGCANGMWAHTLESENGRSPNEGGCLYKSFSPSYEYWSFETEDGKWMPSGDDDYDSLKTIKSLEEYMIDRRIEGYNV